jgi:PHS family inorganic phosphate transporter-like MFS transporter
MSAYCKPWRVSENGLLGCSSCELAGPNQALNAVALVGAFFGQLLFGYLGDKLGRKRVYGMTLLMMIVFSIASGFSFGSTAKGVMTSLCFFR